MKHISQALAIIVRAQQQLKTDFERERAKLELELQRKYATPLRILEDARKSQAARLASLEVLKAEYFGELMETTPRATTTRMKRSFRRERDRRRKYA